MLDTTGGVDRDGAVVKRRVALRRGGAAAWRRPAVVRIENIAAVNAIEACLR